MKVKFMVTLLDKTYESVLYIDEQKFHGCEGFSARNTMNNILDQWAESKILKDYQILDERFEKEIDNMPYMDEATRRELGWNK